jgi:hypothetical protein
VSQTKELPANRAVDDPQLLDYRPDRPGLHEGDNQRAEENPLSYSQRMLSVR